MAVEVSDSWDSESLDKLSPYGLERLSYELQEGGSGSMAESKEYGVYRCARCMHEVYHAKDKFQPQDSGASQWPSFRTPAGEESIRTRRTYSFGLKRTEVMCGKCGLHLGVVYPDGKECGDTKAGAGERHCLLPISLSFEQQVNPNPEPEPEPEPEVEKVKRPVPENISQAAGGEGEGEKSHTPTAPYPGSPARVAVVKSTKSPFRQAVAGKRTKDLLADKDLIDRVAKVAASPVSLKGNSSPAARPQAAASSSPVSGRSAAGAGAAAPAPAAATAKSGFSLMYLAVPIVAAAAVGAIIFTRKQQE